MARRPRPMRSPEPPRLEDAAVVAELDGEGVSDARIVDAEAGQARLRGLQLTDVVVERGNVANVVAPELSLTRVLFTGVRLTGAQWTRGRLTDVVFRDCRIDLATFAGTTFDRVTFEGCLLTQTEFRDALWRSLRFEHCDLTEADLAGVRIDGCELRSCTLDGAVGLDRLRGATMPWPDVVANAGALADALGIRILADDP